MKSNYSVSFAAWVGLFVCLVCSLAAAQATRTWVSGVGDDANPCSRTAPCKTFAGAISKTATGGEIDVLDPGGFGAVTITKAISIEATGVMAGVLVSAGNGIIINAGTGEVVLRGLTFEGVGTGTNGVEILNAGSVHIEDCTIHGFTGHGVDVNTTTAVAVSIKDSFIRGNGGTGVYFHPSGASVLGFLDNVRLERNQVGLRAEDRSNVLARKIVSVNNASDGIASVSSSDTSYITVEDSISANNGNGADLNAAGVKASGPAGRLVLSNSTLTNNYPYVWSALSGGVLFTFGNNQAFGGGAPGSNVVSIGRQ